MSLDSNDDVWQLPIVGFKVLEVWFSAQLYLIAYGDDGGRGVAASRTQIRLGGAFTFVSHEGTSRGLNGESTWETLVPLLALQHSRIVAASADRTGTLDLMFDDGSRLSAPPDADYENWEVDGPGRLNLVAPPGGGDPRMFS